MKKIITILLLLLTLSACGGEKKNITRVIYEIWGGDTISYQVYEFAGDKLVCYDFSAYLMENQGEKFSFLEDALPEAEQYSRSEFPLSEEDFKAISETINEKRFGDLSPELLAEGMDMPTFYITAYDDDGWVKTAGGYGAGYGKDKENERFGAISERLNEMIGKTMMLV